MPTPRSRWSREEAGFTGAEKALLIAFALAVCVLVGALVSGGTRSAGQDARRVLIEQDGKVSALGSLGAESTPQAHDEGGTEAPVVKQPRAGALTAPRATAPTTAPKTTPAAPAAPPDPRAVFLTSYRAWMQARMTEVNALTGDAKVARVEGLLYQMRDVNAQLQAHRIPDLGGLDKSPAPQSTAVAVSSTYLAPELIAPARQLIQTLQHPIAGATRDANAQPGADLYDARDWNSLLGVPQYRTQSDNLVAPEATCNVTSMSMDLERLGYNRQDVMNAIERELKSRIVRQQGQDPSKVDLSQVTLPPNAWTDAASSYLNTNAQASVTYQRVRGMDTTKAQRDALAAQFKDDAKMQDMLDLLLNIKGISRYEIATRGGDVLRMIEPDAAKRPTASILTPSSKMDWNAARQQIQQALDNGGAVMLSIYHKGAGQSGTHLITIQAVTDHGVIVDDPDGHIRSTYRRSKAGDAYADPGSTRAASDYRNVVHRPTDGSVGSQWNWSNGQNLSADESRGNSAEVSDDVLSGAWNRVTIFQRPAAVAQAPAAPFALPGTSPILQQNAPTPEGGPANVPPRGPANAPAFAPANGPPVTRPVAL